MEYPICTPDLMLTEHCNMNCKYCFETNKRLKTMDDDVLTKYIKEGVNVNYFLFGGEPLLRFDTIDKCREIVDSLDQSRKPNSQLQLNIRKIITNGILIPKYAERLKSGNYNCQISCDGPKFINDLNRVDHKGNGTMSKVEEAVEVCEKYKIKWSLHGVTTKETLKYFDEIVKFYFETVLKHKGIEAAIEMLNNNYSQIIFEEDYTDENIKELLNAFNNFCVFIWEDKRFTFDIKQRILKSFLTRSGGVCSAGTSLLGLDTEFNIYPCHRLVNLEERKEYQLGNVFDTNSFKNYKFYNQFFHNSHTHRIMYSSAKDIRGFEHGNYYFNWCPSTNLQTTGSIYHQNPKYNVMHNELYKFIRKLIKKYVLYNIKNKKQEKR